MVVIYYLEQKKKRKNVCWFPIVCVFVCASNDMIFWIFSFLNMEQFLFVFVIVEPVVLFFTIVFPFKCNIFVFVTWKKRERYVFVCVTFYFIFFSEEMFTVFEFNFEELQSFFSGFSSIKLGSYVNNSKFLCF